MSSICAHDHARERDYEDSQIEHTQCLPCDEKKNTDTKIYNLRKKNPSLNYRDSSDTEMDNEFFAAQMETDEEDSEMDDNESLISDESSSSLHETANESIYPKFPISFERENFLHLTDKDWLKFQIILLWDYVKDQNLNLTLNRTYFLYIKTQEDKKNLNFDEITKLYSDYNRKTILAKHFLLSSNNEQNINMNENLNPIVNSIILFHQKFPDFSLIDIVEQCLYKLDENNSKFVRQSFWSPIMLKFSVESIKSASKVLKILNYDDNISFEEKNQRKHDLLFSLLFHNSTSIGVNDLKKFFKISEFLIKKSLDHIQNYKLGKTSSIKTEPRADRVIFAPKVFKLIHEFYEQHTQQWMGKRMVSHIKNNGTSETHHVHFISTTQREFYLLFRFHPEFGLKCKTADGVFRVPEISFFVSLKPYWIRKHPQIGSGYCGHCLKMREFLKTFLQILKKNCKCGSANCPTFCHQPECERFLICDDGTCQECKCCCEICDKCKWSTVGESLTKFMQNLSCCEHRIGGLHYPKITCLLNPSTCECTVCCIPNFESVVNKFCPSAMKNILVDKTCTVITKDWTKETIKMKKPFEIENLEPVELNIMDFLKRFFEFLALRMLKSQPGTFIWHWNGENLQRENYNRTIKKIQDGDFGTSVMMYVMDWAEDWVFKDSRKLAAKEFFKKKKCHIHSITEFGNYNDDFQSCSNFIFSDQNVTSNSITSVADIEDMIANGKEKNPAVKVVLVYSDGAGNEYLTRKVFGKMKDVAKKLNLKIIWNYFFSGHGKGIGDSEISRQKVQLDAKFPDACYERDENGKLKYEKNALGVYNFCMEKLTNWPCNGYQIKSRSFHYRKDCVEEENDFSAVRDTKRLRNVMWDEDGKFYTKRVSCNCVSCILNPLSDQPCEYASLTESFKFTKNKKTILKKKIPKETKIKTINS